MLKHRSLRLEEDRTWLDTRLLRKEAEGKVCIGNETVLCCGQSVPGNSPVVMSGPGAGFSVSSPVRRCLPGRTGFSGRKLCPHLPVAYEGRCL